MSNASTILEVIVGKKIWTCRRAADMAMFQCGNRNKISDYYGREVEIGEYALHVQCPWRILSSEGIVVGSRDLYLPSTYERGSDVPNGFNWDREPNRRDRILEELFDRVHDGYEVQRVEHGLGDWCQIYLLSGLYLQIFPDDSLGEEQWRLFSSNDADGKSTFIGTGRADV